jgi:hypothetical protein
MTLYQNISNCVVVLASIISLAALKPCPRTRSSQLLAVLRMSNRISRSSLCISFSIRAATSSSADGLTPLSALVGSPWFFLLPPCCRGLADRLILAGVFPSGLLGLLEGAMGLFEGVEGPWKDASRLISSVCSSYATSTDELRMQHNDWVQLDEPGVKVRPCRNNECYLLLFAVELAQPSRHRLAPATPGNRKGRLPWTRQPQTGCAYSVLVSFVRGFHNQLIRTILTDGGEARCMTQLLILEEFMHRLETDGVACLPCEYFHLVIGAGAGG